MSLKWENRNHRLHHVKSLCSLFWDRALIYPGLELTLWLKPWYCDPSMSSPPCHQLWQAFVFWSYHFQKANNRTYFAPTISWEQKCWLVNWCLIIICVEYFMIFKEIRQIWRENTQKTEKQYMNACIFICTLKLLLSYNFHKYQC